MKKTLFRVNVEDAGSGKTRIRLGICPPLGTLAPYGELELTDRQANMLVDTLQIMAECRAAVELDVQYGSPQLKASVRAPQQDPEWSDDVPDWTL